MNSQVAVTVLVLAGCLVLLSLVSRQASLDFAGPLRTWLWRRDARRMQARRAFPESISRAYWSAREYERDSAVLRGMGYEVASEEATEPYETLPSVSVIPGLGRTGSMPRRRRVPAYHVVYARAEPPRREGVPAR